MKNIIKVFLSDAKRLSTNVVALVIVMGLSIIPALYAWFNIMSNWDVYGQDATSQMKIAVYSNDIGFTYESLNLNIGQKVVEGLETNKVIGWVFVESEEDAKEGVYAGDYYAALIIPEDFTEDMISFLGGNLENPSIDYYENSKKNAIATKITSKAKKAVQETINQSFIETLAEVISKSSEAITGMETSEGSPMDLTIKKLKEMDNSLITYTNVLNSLALLTDSASGLVGSSSAIIPNVEDLIVSTRATMTSLQKSALSASSAASGVIRMMDTTMDAMDKGLDQIQDASNAATTVMPYVEALLKATQGGANTFDVDAYITSLEVTKRLVGTLKPNDYLTQAQIDEMLANINDTEEQLKELDKQIDEVTKAKEDMLDQLVDVQDALDKQVTAARNSLSKMRNSFDYNIAPNLEQAMYHTQESLIDASAVLAGLNGNFNDIEDALSDYQDTLNKGTTNISATATYVGDVEIKLAELIDGLEALNNDEQYQEVIELFQNNPEVIAKFISSPVELYTEAIYPIDSYGSQMAPFYTTLALWVGGLIVMALVHVQVKPCHDIPKNLRPWQAYFGRYITYWCICSAQATIAVLGDLFFVQIYCVHPFLFWVAAMVISTSFSLLMYSLTVAMENIGEGAAVILLVIQVAGGGGTFPIEVLPPVFQAIYNFLPFKYAMDAMKECIGGFYQFDFVKDLLVLGLFMLISIFIGIVLAVPFRGLNHMIEESKEKSRVML